MAVETTWGGARAARWMGRSRSCAGVTVTTTPSAPTAPSTPHHDVVLWTASRSTLMHPVGHAWLESTAREALSAPGVTLVTGDASSDDVAWQVAVSMPVPRVRFHLDGLVHKRDGTVGRWTAEPPPARDAGRAAWKARALARDRAMADYVARAVASGKARGRCVAAIDPWSATEGAAYTAVHAAKAGLPVERRWFRRTADGRTALKVWTARVTWMDIDRLDVTRSGARRASAAGGGTRDGRDGRDGGVVINGSVFAPSDAILWPAKRALQAADAMEASGDGIGAARLRAETWGRYAAEYRQEMRASYERHRVMWERVLASQRITLVCFCTRPEMCHRTELSDILGVLGAQVMGERGTACEGPSTA